MGMTPVPGPATEGSTEVATSETSTSPVPAVADQRFPCDDRGIRGPVGSDRLVPALATVLAALVLSGAIWPPALLAAAVLTPPAVAALVLARRRQHGLVAAIVAIALWLAVGIGGAVMLANRPTAGFAWIVIVMFVIPLPLLPWLYARTFAPAPNDSDPQAGA